MGNAQVAKDWYVIQVQSGREKTASAKLRENIERSGHEDAFGQVLVPTEDIVEMRAGQRRNSERRIYPGYVLIEMEMNEHTWHVVKNTPQIRGFVGVKSDKPSPISQHDADVILKRASDAPASPKPKTMFEIGERVRVVDGPFSDFNGLVEEVNYEKNRLKVWVVIFGRSTPVELEFIQVEKI